MHPVKGQKRRNALWKYAVRPGKVLNPHGRDGIELGEKYGKEVNDDKSWRPDAMKRRRLKLREDKKRALEMHELTELARENAVDAMQTLIDISKNPRAPEPSRIAASAVILDRGYGKASQVTMSANLTNGKATDLTGDQLDKRIEQALKRVEDITTRAPKAPASKKRPDNLRKLH
jgi:hypothetical protein